MALVSCPECKRQISDQAKSCTGCGYPLERAQEARLYAVFAGHRWRAESVTMSAVYEVTFEKHANLLGELRGTWHIAGSVLFLDFGDHFRIDFYGVSDKKLLGEDQWGRRWEFNRIE